MSVTIKNGRVVEVGDTVTLLGKNWYTDDYVFNQGEVMTIVEGDPEGEMYMNINDGVITVEVEAVRLYSYDFE